MSKRVRWLVPIILASSAALFGLGVVAMLSPMRGGDAGPKLRVDTPLKSFREVRAGEVARVTFAVTNQGEGPITIIGATKG